MMCARFGNIGFFFHSNENQSFNIYVVIQSSLKKIIRQMYIYPDRHSNGKILMKAPTRYAIKEERIAINHDLVKN